MKTLALTTGDTDGIGLEVSAKALNKIGPQKDHLFFLLRDQSAPKRYLSLIDKKFERVTFSRYQDAKDFILASRKKKTSLSKRILIDLASTEPPPIWVEQAARSCHEKILSGLVTAPLSKELIASLGWKDRGHTEILKRITGVPFIHQSFVGRHFNVVLATAHCPLGEVSQSLTQPVLKSTLTAARKLQEVLPRLQKSKPIALLGLNPHAGENGILGKEELNLLVPFCKSNKIIGPLSPDAAFLKKNWSLFSTYIACYHDQGLIPFKMIHGQNSGVQVSIGLSFPRTSVDHGTAKDIFGKNIANANSMLESIKLALRLIKK